MKGQREREEEVKGGKEGGRWEDEKERKTTPQDT